MTAWSAIRPEKQNFGNELSVHWSDFVSHYYKRCVRSNGSLNNSVFLSPSSSQPQHILVINCLGLKADEY